MKLKTLFVPLTKVDEDKRLVYGVMAQGTVVDKADEIFDYVGSKPHFEKWSADVAKASGGKSLGNVRAMHSNKAAGKLTDIVFNDEAETIECCAKIVDEDEWQKVLEGVYTGFSIGGKYVKKWKDKETGLSRYIADPVEVSIVDVPCIPTATFDLTRADGSVVKMIFKAADKAFVPDNAAIAARATEMAQAVASESSWVEHIDKAREALIAEDAEKKAAKDEKKKKKTEAEAGVEAEDAGNEASEDDDAEKKEDTDEDDAEKKDDKEEKDEDKKKADKTVLDALAQVWRATDGRTFSKKADAVSHQAVIQAAANAHPLTKAISDLKSMLDGKEVDTLPACFSDLHKAGKALKGLRAMVKNDELVTKSMWDVSWFARMLEDMACLQSCVTSEADWEGDNSPVPVHLRDNIKALTLTFIEFAMEEAAELVARLKPEEVEVLTDAGAGTADVAVAAVDATDDPEVAVHAAEAAKYILANQAEKLEKIRAGNSTSDQERLQKAQDLLKAAGVAALEGPEEEKEVLAKAAADLAKVSAERDSYKKALDDALPAITQLKADVAKLRAEPGPSAPRTHVVEKTADRNPAGTPAPGTETIQQVLAKMTPEQLQDLAIRAAQSRPVSLIDRGKN